MTMKIEKFDKPIARHVNDEAMKRLQAYAEEIGATLERGAGRYTDGTYEMKVVFKLKNVGGVSADQATFNRYCGIFGLKPEHFGQTFVTQLGEVRIVGLDLKKRKFPVTIERVETKQRYGYTVAAIISALAAKAGLDATSDHDDTVTFRCDGCNREWQGRRGLGYDSCGKCGGVCYAAKE